MYKYLSTGADTTQTSLLASNLIGASPHQDLTIGQALPTTPLAFHFRQGSARILNCQNSLAKLCPLRFPNNLTPTLLTTQSQGSFGGLEELGKPSWLGPRREMETNESCFHPPPGWIGRPHKLLSVSRKLHPPPLIPMLPRAQWTASTVRRLSPTCK